MYGNGVNTMLILGVGVSVLVFCAVPLPSSSYDASRQYFPFPFPMLRDDACFIKQKTKQKNRRRNGKHIKVNHFVKGSPLLYQSHDEQWFYQIFHDFSQSNGRIRINNNISNRRGWDRRWIPERNIRHYTQLTGSGSVVVVVERWLRLKCAKGWKLNRSRVGSGTRRRCALY